MKLSDGTKCLSEAAEELCRIRQAVQYSFISKYLNFSEGRLK